MCFDLNRFVDKNLASHFTCSICQCVMCCPQADKTQPSSKQEPNNNNRAGHKYCEKCIIDWLNRNESCPDCREHLEIKDLQALDRTSLNILKELQIRCRYFTQGCKITTKLESIVQHELLECPFRSKPCWRCGSISTNLDVTCKDCIENFNEIIKNKDNEIEILKMKIEDLNNENNKALKLNDEINIKNRQIKILNNQLRKLQTENNESKSKFTGFAIDENNTTHSEYTINEEELIELCASEKNHYDRIKQLIQIEKTNVNLNDTYRDRKTPLMLASQNGHTNIVQLLIEHNANIKEKSNSGDTALILASKNGNKEIVQVLIKNRAHFNEENNEGDTALSIAKKVGNEEIANLFVENTVTETVIKRPHISRTSRGPVGIQEISQDGKFILLSNSGRYGDIDISRWQIRRKVDDDPELLFSFLSNTIIGAGKTIKIWFKGCGMSNPPFEYVADFFWKRDTNLMVTRLFTEIGEERTSYIEKITS